MFCLGIVRMISVDAPVTNNIDGYQKYLTNKTSFARQQLTYEYTM